MFPLSVRILRPAALALSSAALTVSAARAQATPGQVSGAREAMSYDFLLAITEPEDLGAADELGEAFAEQAVENFAHAANGRPVTRARDVSLGGSAYTVTVTDARSEADLLEAIARTHVTAIAPPPDLPLVDLVGGATMYRLLGDDAASVMWYARIVDVSDDPINYFFYARALRALGQDALADEYTSRYARASRR